MIKIAFIISGLGNGGAEIMLFKLLSRLDRAQFAPVVISMTGDGPTARLIETLDIPVHQMNMTRSFSMFRRFGNFLRLLRELKPDILQGWMYHANLAAQAGAWFIPGNIPVLWNIRATPVPLGQFGVLTTLIIWIGGKLSFLPLRIINNSVVSARVHTDYFGYCSSRQKVIPNGFDTAHFAPAEEARKRLREELGLPADGLLVGLIGRYHPMKDHPNFLRAAADLLHTHPDIYIILAGSDMEPRNHSLVSLIKRLGLQESVRLLGRREDIAYITAALDISVCASTTEGFPNVVGEAMCCGVPCIVTNVGDSALVVSDTGYVVPPGNPVELALAMRRMIDLGAAGRKQLGARARERIIERFDIDLIARRYQCLYQSIHKLQAIH